MHPNNSGFECSDPTNGHLLSPEPPSLYGSEKDFFPSIKTLGSALLPQTLVSVCVGREVLGTHSSPRGSRLAQDSALRSICMAGTGSTRAPAQLGDRQDRGSPQPCPATHGFAGLPQSSKNPPSSASFLGTAVGQRPQTQGQHPASKSWGQLPVPTSQGAGSHPDPKSAGHSGRGGPGPTAATGELNSH